MRKHIWILICWMIMALLTGCGNSAQETENHGFIAIVGNHAGSFVPRYASAQSAIMRACQSQGNVCIIVADGSPYLATGGVINIPAQPSNLSKKKLASIYESQSNQLMTLMQTSYARTAEVDLLKALTLCAREANSSQFSTGSDIYIYDAGVDTVNLNMTKLNLERTDVDTVVSTLLEENMIPDLSSLGTLQWYNLGDTDYDLSNAQAEGLKKLWTAIIEAGGGQVCFHTDPSTTPFEVELPYVSSIPDTSEVIDWSAEVSVDGIEESIVFDDSEISFKAGEAAFMDELQAATTLSKLTDFLRENESESILVIATTADWGTVTYQNQLSSQRADTVKQYFMKEGIDESRISTVGLGASSGFYINDHNCDGTLNEERAKQNRKVIIMSRKSQNAEKILNGEFGR